MNSALAFGPTRGTPEVEHRKGAQRLSKLLGDLPVLMAAPFEGEEEDECAMQQVNSLIQALKDMPAATRGKIAEDLKSAGVRSVEIKRTSPKYDERIIGERIIMMDEPKVTQKVDDLNSLHWKRIDHYGNTGSWDVIRFEGQSWEQVEFLPWVGFGRKGSWLLDNVNDTILERARRLQNESQLKSGHLVITPKSHKYTLHRAEYLLPAALFAKTKSFQEFLAAVKSGAATHTESYWAPDHKPYLHACFGPIGLGDLISASSSASERF
jgi:hypothetical protein